MSGHGVRHPSKSLLPLPRLNCGIGLIIVVREPVQQKRCYCERANIYNSIIYNFRIDQFRYLCLYFMYMGYVPEMIGVEIIKTAALALERSHQTDFCRAGTRTDYQGFTISVIRCR